jgi:hypothetical protein
MIYEHLVRGETEPTWRRKISWSDRQATDAVSEWIQPVDWKWFLTLTSPSKLREETAEKKLKVLANSLEKFYRANICYVAARESRPLSQGMNVPHHFHLLLTSRAAISKEVIESSWARIVRGTASEHAKAEPYRSDLLGPEYCLKSIYDSDGNWYL